MTREESEPTLIGSIQRALRLLEIVAESPRPIPVKVLASRTHLSMGTCYNITRTLVHEQYLSREPDGLILGPRFPLRDVSARAGAALARTRSALHDVADVSGASAYFSRFDDGEVRIIDMYEGRSQERLELWVGINESAHATACGKRILSHLSHDQRDDYFSRHALEALTPNTIRDRRSLLRELDPQTVATIDREEYAIGFDCIAVPVLTPDVIGSIGVALPKASRPRDPEPIIAALRTSAARLSMDLAALAS
jgi:DNA-binding IclR family transcriptional regulator